MVPAGCAHDTALCGCTKTHVLGHQSFLDVASISLEDSIIGCHSNYLV